MKTLCKQLLPYYQRRRCIALAESGQMKTLGARVPVLAIRRNEDRFQHLAGLSIAMVEKVSKFLARVTNEGHVFLTN